MKAKESQRRRRRQSFETYASSELNNDDQDLVGFPDSDTAAREGEEGSEEEEVNSQGLLDAQDMGLCGFDDEMVRPRVRILFSDLTSIRIDRLDKSPV